MLPRSYRFWIPDNQRFSLGKGTHSVRHDSMFGPITTPDNVAGTGGGHGWASTRKEGIPVSCSDQLCAALATGIRISATHGFVFAVPPHPLAILVTLITGDHDHRFHSR